MPKNNFYHVEIVSKDPEKTSKFYSSVFDQEIKFLEEMNYFTFNDGSVGGGFTKPEDEMSSGTVLYINTDDIKKSLDQIKANGGTVIREKSEIPSVGWYGLFKDPEGNLVGLLTLLKTD